MKTRKQIIFKIWKYLRHMGDGSKSQRSVLKKFQNETMTGKKYSES